MWPALDRARLPIGLGCVVLVFGAFMAGSFHWTSESAKALDAERRVSLRETVLQASALTESGLLADAARVERLRLEIRSEVRWQANHLARDGRLFLDPDDSSFARETDARRLHGLLRRTLDDWSGATAIELLVASDEGIWTHRVERRALGSPERPVAARTPQTLWYAPSVQRAIAASGRRSEVGEIRWSEAKQGQGAPRPVGRVSIALQNPGEVTQGVLVASLDASSWAAPLAMLATKDIALDLQTAKGQSLRPLLDTADAASGPGVPTANSQSAATSDRPLGELIASAGQYELAQAVQTGGDTSASIAVVGRVAIPEQGWRAWWQSDFRLAAGALLLLTLVYEWIRRGAGAPRIIQYEAIPLDAQPASPDDDQDIDRRPGDDATDSIVPVTFALREWLGDLRSCLERAAAQQDRQLSLRCERSLAPEIVSDAAGLGGLLLALGREALSHTPNDQIALEVSQDADSALRFEFDAGGDTIVPAAGMRRMARSLGGRFVPCPTGRVALTVPVDAR